MNLFDEIRELLTIYSHTKDAHALKMLKEKLDEANLEYEDMKMKFTLLSEHLKELSELLK